MKSAVSLYNLIKSISQPNEEVLYGQVKSYDKEKSTCVVIVDGLEVENVRLKAIADDSKGFKVFPKIGSAVLIESISAGVFVIKMCSEIELVLLEIDDKKLELDSKGFWIGNEGESLLKVMNLIIDAVIKIVVLQGQNPDYVKLNQAKNLVKKILK